MKNSVVFHALFALFWTSCSYNLNEGKITPVVQEPDFVTYYPYPSMTSYKCIYSSFMEKEMSSDRKHIRFTGWSSLHVNPSKLHGDAPSKMYFYASDNEYSLTIEYKHEGEYFSCELDTGKLH